jgi:hypothetical protein
VMTRVGEVRENSRWGWKVSSWEDLPLILGRAKGALNYNGKLMAEDGVS